jgi:hypothetical protein
MPAPLALVVNGGEYDVDGYGYFRSPSWAFIVFIVKDGARLAWYSGLVRAGRRPAAN